MRESIKKIIYKDLYDNKILEAYLWSDGVVSISTDKNKYNSFFVLSNRKRKLLIKFLQKKK